MSTPGYIKAKLGRIQDEVETLLRDQPYFVGPLEILEIVAEALYTSEKPRVGWEVTELIIRLREQELGLAKSRQSKPF